MTDQPQKLDLTSHNLPADKTAELLHLFPEIRTEGDKIDFDKLKLVLGQTVDVGKERYGMTWPGKADCFKTIQAPSTGTLLPVPEESVDFDITENLIIEGDNLNVLKLLQKAYLGRVKMIYIDPPYNTGNDFIYPDNYTESLQTYLEYTGQIDSEGKKFGTNTEDSGRFHTKWINMMYPRLYLARNLLRDDGVVFVSIDDNESHNLRALMNDIFGEENYLTSFYIQVRYASKTLTEDSDFHKLIETVHVYQKSSATRLNKSKTQYSLDSFVWGIRETGKPTITELGGKKVEIFKAGDFEIVKGEPSQDGLKEIWASGKILDVNSSGRFFRDYLTGRYGTDGYGSLYKVYGVGNDSLEYRYFTGPKKVGATKGKYYQGVPVNVLENIEEVQTEEPITNFYNFADAFGNCRLEGGVDFRSGKKPIEFIKTLIGLVTNPNDNEIVLDFFAGSCSTAHAVLDLNNSDSGNRKFIVVQLPEPMEEKEFKTIADLGKERVRRVINDFNKIDGGQLPLGGKRDRGFRVFKLAESNFKGWDASTPKDGKALEQQLELHIEHVREGRTSEDILYEILLKSGFSLTTLVEKIELEGKAVYSVAGGGMLICLEKELSLEVIRAMAEKKPQRVICLDLGFAGNDQLKANAVQIFKTKEVVFKTV